MSSTHSPTILRTTVSNANPGKYYVGAEEDIAVGSYDLSVDSYRFSIDTEESKCFTGEISNVDIITSGFLNPQRVQSGLIQINEKLSNLNRPAFRTNSHRLLIMNFTKYNLTSVDRNGIKTHEPPQGRPVDYLHAKHANTVVIREEYYYETAKSARASLELMKNTPTTKGLVAKKVTKLLDASQNRCSLGCCIVVDYLIHESKLLDLITIYHTNTDLLLSVSNQPELLEHPCSPDYVVAPLCNGPTGEKDVFSTFRYVSNNPNAQSLYVRVAGQTLQLRPCKASREYAFTNLIDGIEMIDYHDEYILVNLQQTNSNTAALASPGTCGPTKVIYRPYVIPVGDGMEKFGIFRTDVDATKEFIDVSFKERKYEDTIHLLKMDLAKTKLDIDDTKREARDDIRTQNDKIAELKGDIRRDAVAHADEIARKDKIIEELKKSNHKETEEIKEKREATTHKTKTFHDYVKIFFAIVAGVLALIPLYLKFRVANPVPLPI